MRVILENNREAIALACKTLSEGGAVSFATDTVYGIAVDASNERAVSHLYDLKKRDPNKPVAIFVQDIESAKNIFYFDEMAKKIAENFLPGSLTLVLKQSLEGNIKIAKNLNSNTENFLGFRIVDCEFVKNLMAEFRGVLAVTSANPSGMDPAISAQEVEKYFKNSGLELVIDGGVLMQKNISTVVQISDDKIKILRHGVVKESLIQKILNL